MKRATRLIQMPTHHSTTLAGNYTISRSLKYSCSGACLAVILLLGSYRCIFCQQTEIGQLNALKLFDGTVMVINCYGCEGPNRRPEGGVNGSLKFDLKNRREKSRLHPTHLGRRVSVPHSSERLSALGILTRQIWNTHAKVQR